MLGDDHRQVPHYRKGLNVGKPRPEERAITTCRRAGWVVHGQGAEPSTYTAYHVFPVKCHCHLQSGRHQTRPAAEAAVAGAGPDNDRPRRRRAGRPAGSAAPRADPSRQLLREHKVA